MAGKRPSAQAARGTGIRRAQDKRKASTPQPQINKGAAEKKAAFYKKILDTDYSYLLYTERAGKYLPGGLDAARAANENTLKKVKKFKEHAARCLAEFDATGYLVGYPPSASFSVPSMMSKL